jgi:MFS family permease
MKQKLFLISLSEFMLNVGRGALTLVLGLFLYKETGGLWAFALAFLSDFLIAIFIQSMAGNLVDKKGFIRVLNYSLTISTLVLVICWLCLLFFDDVTLIVLSGAIVLNILRPFIRTSVFSLVPSLFDQDSLEKANGFVSVSLQFGQVIGMIIAGLSLETGSTSFSFFLIMSSFLISTVSYFILNKQMEWVRPVSKVQNKMGVYDSIRLLKNAQMRLSFLIGSFDYAVIAIFNLLLAPLVAQNFDGFPRWLTLLDGAYAFGAIISGFVISRSSKAFGLQYRYSLLSLLSTGLLFITYAMKAPTLIVMLLIITFGYCSTISVVIWNTNLQKLAPQHLRGRIASLKYLINTLLVATCISIISFANDYSFVIAAYISAALVAVFFVVTLCMTILAKLKTPTVSTNKCNGSQI